ncbi:LacI family DNA-binding transcriptional regulator, partial [Salmonella enterica subsp. enterica serovar Infantis]
MDVARLAGVSVATGSLVITDSPTASEASRLAVTSAMESLSYHPNANARARAPPAPEPRGLVVGGVSAPGFGAMGKAGDPVA